MLYLQYLLVYIMQRLDCTVQFQYMELSGMNVASVSPSRSWILGVQHCVCNKVLYDPMEVSVTSVATVTADPRKYV